MTNRTRNFAILSLVLLLLGGAFALIFSKPTRLGLDLRGGTELVYEGRQSTPQAPPVTPQAIDDAITTIRKRTDALGVSEPEIQRSGARQISIGLPDVKNTQRAKDQVGTTAQLYFYDWEPNVLGDRGPGSPFSGSKALFQAVGVASKLKPKVEDTDVPPGGVEDKVRKRFGGDRKQIRAFYDRANDSSRTKYYLFGPDQKLRKGPDTSCLELLADYEKKPGAAPRYVKDTECVPQLRELGGGGPPAGSTVSKVPQGIVVVEADPAPGQPKRIKKYYVLEDDYELSGRDIKNPQQSYDPQTNEPVVTMEFTKKGREAFARATKREAQRGFDAFTTRNIATDPPQKDNYLQNFAITLDNRIVSLANIDFSENPEGIDGRTGAQISGINSVQETQDLAESLRIGALPIELKLISQTQVSATLGQQALNQGLIAAAVGLALTILFLLFFYRVLGVVATGTLLLYALFLFALVKLIPITLTLPGIAGLVLTLAVAADANIVMYERIKEEARTGRSIPAAIASGYAKALRTIIDANVVTIGVAFILFMLATAGVKGFAFTLGVGTIVSLFTAVLATSAVLGSLSRTRLLAHPAALGVGKASSERARWRFDFMGGSRWFFSFSGLILATGAVAIAALGINFGIDFESGTRLTAPLQRDASVQQVRDVLAPLGYGDSKIQEVNDPELGRNVVQIATGTLQPPEVTKVERALEDEFGAGDVSSTSIGPTFGAQIARTAIVAIVASLLLISLYIGFRFEFKFAVPVLIALAHDLLITAGVFALADREVTTATVAALLTIMGYSLYDTVIVFDRIRENVPRMPRATFTQIANRSMSEVFTRSLATSFVVLMPVGSLLVFGGETLQDFAFALLVGVTSGAYSSIFIATPVLVEWKEREPVYMRRRRLTMEEHGGVVPAFASATIAGARGAPAPKGSPTGASATAPLTSSHPPVEAQPGAGDGPDANGPAEPPSTPSTTGTPKQKRRKNTKRKHGRR